MKIKLLFACFILVIGNSIQAQSYYNTDFSITASNTDNLFKNYSNVTEHFTSLKGTINLYRTDIEQLSFFADYTNYGNNPNLSNIKYGGGITLLPLSDSSEFTLFLNLNYQGYSYKNALTTNSSDFSNENIDGMISLGYQVNEKTNVRIGLNSTLTGYASSSVTDKNLRDIFAGINISLFGSNAFDLEGGYSHEKYDYLPEYHPDFGIHYGIQPRNAYSLLEKSDLNSFYLSLRYSRPLGNKSGLSLTYSFREFTDFKDSSMIYGFSTGYLSPWVASYEGNSVQVKIKTYLIPFTILNFGFGYWNSSYLKTLELGYYDFLGELLSRVNTEDGQLRDDDKYQMFLSFSIPIVTSSGRLFEPSLKIDYIDNNSSIANYTFSNFTASISLNIK